MILNELKPNTHSPTLNPNSSPVHLAPFVRPVVCQVVVALLGYKGLGSGLMVQLGSGFSFESADFGFE